MTTESLPLIFLVAGEPSGDALGARLMAALKERTGGSVAFAGVGGPLMAAQGLASLFPMEDLAVMGLAEVLPRLRLILARLRQTAAHALALNPDAVVTIDAPDFSFRLARRLKGRVAPLIHYVAPSVWAWRPGRARKIAAFLDHLLAFLPFEPPYFEREGLACTCVGHPVVEQGVGGGDGAAFRQRHAIAADAPILVVLPGSRKGEAGRLLPVFGATVARLVALEPGLRVVVPTLGTVEPLVREAVEGWACAPVVVTGEREKWDAFAAGRAALAASGTVALELARAGLPQVVAYRVNPVTAWLARRLVRVEHVNLVNLLLGRRLVPELLQEDCTPERLAAEIGRLLAEPAARDEQRAGEGEAMRLLGLGGPSPSLRAADIILSLLNKRAE